MAVRLASDGNLVWVVCKHLRCINGLMRISVLVRKQDVLFLINSVLVRDVFPLFIFGYDILNILMFLVVMFLTIMFLIIAFLAILRIVYS